MDTLHFIGTSDRAANWLEIGQTKGRGRQDRFNENAKTVKAIYGYELEPDVRTRLAAIAEPLQVTALQISEDLDGDEWAGHEFGGAHLGDRRSNMRLADLARTIGEMPARAFCGAAQGNKPAIKSYYRLIEQADDSPVTMQAILASHQRRTMQRMKAQSTVLCVQDGTELNYSGLEKARDGHAQRDAHVNLRHSNSARRQNTRPGRPSGCGWCMFTNPRRQPAPNRSNGS